MRDVFFSNQPVEVRASTPEQVRVALRDMYAARVTLSSAGGVQYRHVVTRDGPLAVGRGQLTGRVAVKSEPLPFLCVAQLAANRQEVEAAGQRYERSDSTPFLFPQGAYKTLRWDEAALHQVVLRAADVDIALAQLGRSAGVPPLGRAR